MTFLQTQDIYLFIYELHVFLVCLFIPYCCFQLFIFFCKFVFLAPDGVYILNVSAESSTSVLILWSPVGRANSPEEVSYVLQFRHNDDSVIRE